MKFKDLEVSGAFSLYVDNSRVAAIGVGYTPLEEAKETYACHEVVKVDFSYFGIYLKRVEEVREVEADEETDQDWEVSIVGDTDDEEPTEYTFKVGDRVKYVSDAEETPAGEECTIIYISGIGDYPYLVEFDNCFDCGHDGGGRGADGRCYWCSRGDLELIESESITNEVESIDFPEEDVREPDVYYGDEIELSAKMGERVKYVGADERLVDQVGMVKDIRLDRGPEPYLIEFDNAIEGCHGGSGQGKDGHCWYCESRDLELVEERKEG